MPLNLNTPPDEAWSKYITPYLANPEWLESGADIDDSIKLSKRELLGLVLYSYHLDKSGNARVCWDSDDPEPNDGFVVTPDGSKIHCEHKIVPQFNTDEVMEAVKSTYKKYKKLGAPYGDNLHLIIHANRQSQGMARITKLADEIGNECPFEKVIMTGVNGFEGGGIIRFGFSEQFPNRTIEHLRIQTNNGKLVG